MELLKENMDDMHKVVAYLLEKETITGGEMVAIIEGRDPALVEDAYASTRKSEKAFRPSQPDQIEAPAKHIHIVSEEIKPPKPDEGEEEPEPGSGDRPEEDQPEQSKSGDAAARSETQDGPGPGQDDPSV